jgi:16S rRNA (guanine1207-N2)-methyltransferase
LSEHYFTRKPQSEHEERIIRETLRGREFTFVTDAGVFSRGGVDFGTRLLIETMDIPPAARVLDVGCGYGPIGIVAAALAPSGRVTMIDVNARAVELARRNAQLNRIGNAEVMESDLFANVPAETYDVILTNPPIRAGKQTVHQIFEQAAHFLAPGGRLWIVIRKQQGAPSAFAKLEQLFGSVREMAKAKGYRVYRAEKDADDDASS